MPIAVVCSGCNRRLKAPDRLAGKRIRCPQCKEPVQVPQPGPPPLPAAVAADLEEPEQEPRPPSRKRSRRESPPVPAANKHLWVLAIGCSGLLVLVGGGLVGVILWAKFKQPARPEIVTVVDSSVKEQVQPVQTKLPESKKKSLVPPKPPEKESGVPPNPHVGQGRYYFRDMGFSLLWPTDSSVPPKKWQSFFTPDRKNPFLSFLGPSANVKPGLTLDRPHLLIDRLDNLDGAPLDQFVATQKVELAKEFKGMRVLDEGPVTIDGKPAFSLSYSCPVKNGPETVPTKWLKYYMAPDSQKRFVITLVALPDQFDQIREMIAQCALSAHSD